MGFSHYPKLDDCCFHKDDLPLRAGETRVEYRRAASFTRLFYTVATDQPGEIEVALTLEPGLDAMVLSFDAVEKKSYKPGDDRLYFCICAGSWMRLTYRNQSGADQSFFRLRVWGSVF